MLLPLNAVREAFESYGIVFSEPLSHGLKRHNDSISDNSSIFIKVLGHSNNLEAFQRELGAAELFPYAPQPLIPEVVFVGAEDSESGRVPCTAWVFYEGVDVNPRTFTEAKATELGGLLRRVYVTPLDTAHFAIPTVNFAAINRRIVQARKATPEHYQNRLSDVIQLVDYAENLLLQLNQSKKVRKAMIHGDPHLGNVIELTEAGKQQLLAASGVHPTSLMLLDYESMKAGPIEYDLACLYQNLIQVCDNSTAYNALVKCFEDVSHELYGSGLDEEVLNAYIQFRNVSTLTYLLSFQNWDLICSRLDALLPMMKTGVPPLRLDEQIL